MAIGHRKHLIGHDIGMGIAQTCRALPRGKEVHRLVGQHPGHAIEQAEIHMLAHTRPRAFRQRRLNADDAVKPGKDIGKGHADLLRLARRIAGQVHDAAHPLDQEIVSGAMGIGAVLSKAGDRAIDKARVDLFDAVIIEAEFLQPADLEILDQHIRLADQVQQFGPVARIAEIQRDRGLAPVGAVEIGSRAVALALDKGRAPFAGVVALGAFDLEHLGAQIGQGLADPGPCQNAGQFDHFQPLQRCAHLPALSLPVTSGQVLP